MRSEDQGAILAELERRISESCPAREALEEAMYWERKRLKEDRKSPSRDADQRFWSATQAALRKASIEDQKTLLRKAVRHYGEEIAGNFDERVYAAVTRVLPPALGLLLNAVSPMRVVKRLPDLPQLDDAVIIRGETAHLHHLREHGTVILVPTHVSNLDSMVIGFALYRLGLPPFIYGAGLNLFTNPLLGFFMHNLGAYTVDRKKQDPLYKDVLKEYATLTLEHGYDNLFFPGGTRSRSGAVEQRLKLGLLGTGVTAYVNNLRRGASQPRIFIVPATLSFQLVLEAETLIDDFLKEVGKSRYIIDDDEFSQPKTVFDFMAKLFSLDSKIHVTVCRGYDPFGNPVDDGGRSLDPCGRTIDTVRYVLSEGEPKAIEDRDAEYTREVGVRIAEEYMRHSVVESTHVAAFSILGLLRDRNPRMDVLRILRTGGEEEDLSLAAVYEAVDRVLEDLRQMAQRNAIQLGPSAMGSAEDVLHDALAHFGCYHSRPAAQRRGDRLIPADRTLLLYYQNRLEGYGLHERFGRRPSLTPDHRSLLS
jgi:glycerol-3-phosphate O-acyltransferase